MRHEATPPARLPQIVRGAVAQQQVRAGVAQAGIEAALPPVYADEAAAAAGGVPINGVYREGSDFVVRTA